MEPPGTPIGARLLLLLYGLSLLGATALPGKPADALSDQETIDLLATLLNRQAAMAGATNQRQNELGPDDLQEEPSGKNRAGIPDVTPKPPPASSGAVKGSPVPQRNQMTDALLLGLVVSCTVVGLTALVVATICWCRLKKEMKLAQKTDYSSSKVPGPPPYEKSSPVDKKLAQSAQMYHYQHQKQQMLSMEKTKDEPKLPDSNTTSDEENEDGDFTVYECPGLAPTGEMEVKNPLFDDSSLHHPNSKSQ